MSAPPIDATTFSPAPPADLLRERPCLARPRDAWSGLPIPGIIKQVLGNIQTHRRVRRLLHLPAFIDTVENNPKFAFKYLTWQYLARGLTIPERAACFLHHYQRLHTLLPDRLLRQVLHWDVPLHEIHEGNNCLTLSMGRSRPCYKEGELSLHLKIDGEIFFTLAFTIIPGWVVQANAAEVLLISRLQGTYGCYPDQMKLATKAMHGVRPRTALLCALEGIAQACDIREVASVSAARHTSCCADCERSLLKSYDDFFAELGFIRNPAGFFLAEVPIKEIPLEQISPGNRPRAKKNRALKQQMREASAAFFNKLQHAATDSQLHPVL
jgi:uncharacterized protein VirK/YbjX